MDTQTPQQTTDKKGQIECACSQDGCTREFRGGSVGELAKKIASHWNTEHSSALRHNYEVLETEEYGGDHIKDDIYQVKKRKIRVTSYDVIAPNRSQPFDEAFAIPTDPRCCADCWRYTGSKELDAHELNSPGIWDCEYKCEYCYSIEDDPERPDYDEEREKSHQLTEF
jgi:hypothetical protein